ncbi:AAA family ATPase [Methanobacterium sp. ACI-7]|uniref:AAA family ATPase n=1 Tax=unclassified Methanobacterium TaxID=2627676 RepID=UPI0039C08835
MDINKINLEAENFYRNFKDKSENLMGIFEEFITLYPFQEHPEKIDLLEPNDVYNPGNPSFLYYIEHGLADFGRVRVGSSKYAENAKKQIDLFKKLLYIVVDDSISIAEKVDAPWKKIKYFGKDRHLAKKIVFCYNSDRLLPIYNTNHLEYFASEIDSEFKFKSNNFNKDYESLSRGEKFEYLNNIIFKFKKEFIETEMDNISFMWFLYSYLTPPDYKRDINDNNDVKKWFFTVNMDLNPNFKQKSRIKWNSAKEVKKGDILLFYCGKPHSHIGEIFIAESDPYEDQSTKEKWNGLAVDVNKIIDIKNPIEWNEIKENEIIKNNAAIKMHFGRSHFKVSNKEWEELKRIIIDKNPELIELINEIDELKSPCFNNGHRGRAHITRDICYIIANNKNLTEEKLKDILIQSVDDNEDYWKAYFQNCKKKNCIGYNIESARSLNLIDCDDLSLTEIGNELVNKISSDELYNHYYSLETKRFFYQLALQDDIINTAMEILKEKEKMRFWSPKCDLTKKVIWEYNHDTFICNETKYPECKDCDHKVLNHIGKTSLVLETLKKSSKHNGFVFWFSSRITPMYLVGQAPTYAGEHIYWDKDAERELKGKDSGENEFLKFLKEIYSHEMQVALRELERGKNVIFYGPPGSGKTVLSKIISEKHLGKNAYLLYTVHSGTDYYDLVCRIVPKINEEGNLIYSKEPRFLLDALLCGKVLILDEINRTQIDTALGIFFTYLERDHRINDVEQIREILKKETDEELEINDLRTRLDNFRIIGTLNVYDKTFLFKLGDALKRRFTFIEITTKKDLIAELTSTDQFKKEFMEACDYKGELNTANTIIDVFANLNNIKPLGIGILKDSLQFSSNFSDNAADLSISSLIVPFFENDLNYSNILAIFEKYDLKVSISKLKSLNFGTSDINGI